MKIKICADKIKKYKITAVDALHEDNLPGEYTSSAPYIYKYGSKSEYCRLTYFNNKTELYHAVDISPGDEFTELELKTLNHHIRLAGERLNRINLSARNQNAKNKPKEEKKPIEDWSGTYTIEV